MKLRNHLSTSGGVLICGERALAVAVAEVDEKF